MKIILFRNESPQLVTIQRACSSVSAYPCSHRHLHYSISTGAGACHRTSPPPACAAQHKSLASAPPDHAHYFVILFSSISLLLRLLLVHLHRPVGHLGGRLHALRRPWVHGPLIRVRSQPLALGSRSWSTRSLTRTGLPDTISFLTASRVLVVDLGLLLLIKLVERDARLVLPAGLPGRLGLEFEVSKFVIE